MRARHRLHVAATHDPDRENQSAQAHHHIVRHGVGVGRVFDVGSDDGADATTPPATEGTVAETPSRPTRPRTPPPTRRPTRTERLRTRPQTTVADTEAPAATFPPVTDDRAPGVTDTSVKVGVMYLDLSPGRTDPRDQPG